MTDAVGEKIKHSISQNFSNTFIMMNKWIGIKKKINPLNIFTEHQFIR